MKPSISNTLKLLMFQKDIKTTQLAREINMPQQTLQRIVSGATPHPHPNTLKPLAEYFSISIEQLKGEAPIPSLRKSSVFTVPFISWSDAIHPNEIANSKNQIAYTNAKVGPRAFALRVKDSAMEPFFTSGVTLIIDPDLAVQDRCYVIAHLKGQTEATFRQLLIDLENQYLKALSPDFSQFPMIKLSAEDHICGVLVQTQQDF
jgi:SOS-response transcriptional repressor LexA